MECELVQAAKMSTDSYFLKFRTSKGRFTLRFQDTAATVYGAKVLIKCDPKVSYE